MYASAMEILGNEHQAQMFARWAIYLLVGHEQATLPRDTAALAWIAKQLTDALDSGRLRLRARRDGYDATSASLAAPGARRTHERDPEFDALRRAVRAAIVVPIAAALSFAVGG